MRKIILRNLSLINWRGEKERTTHFDQHETTIAGANGLGKSRHFDAFMWLLFGKDKEDRKDFNIRSFVNGEPLHKVDSEVSAVLEVDEVEIVLCRRYVEEWVKPRGQAKQVFKGNKTECYWNGVPVSIKEYSQRIASIIEENVFKMLTNPLYFSTQPWKVQREQLFLLAGTVQDEELAQNNLQFKALLDKLSGKSIEDFKREASARKKRLRSDLEEIQPRIDQTMLLKPEPIDYDSLEQKLSSVEQEIDKIDKAISDTGERVNQKQQAIQERQNKINELKQQCQQLLFDAESQAKDDAFNANTNRRELQERVKTVKREIHGYVQDEISAKGQLEKLQNQVQELTSKSNALRKEWYLENENIYQGETTCSCCGQELPDAMKAEALEYFNKHKESRLKEITSKGKGYKSQIDEIEKKILEVEQDKCNAIAGAKEKEAELQDLEKQLSACSEIKQVEVMPEEIKGYTELSSQIAELEAEQRGYQNAINSDNIKDYQTRKKELNAQRDEVKAKLNGRERIKECDEQIAELEAKGKDLAQQIADIEREEYNIQQFTSAKVEECNKRINSLFSMVSFQLFEYTIEDSRRENPIETCIPLVNGVPFTVANTAGQVNAGLEIINALTRFYGITAPIFIDNRESVNQLIPTESQIINLKVTEDKKLIII